MIDDIDTKKIGVTEEDLKKIINVVSRINTIREINSLLDQILVSAEEMIDAEAGSIILQEKETGFFTIQAATGDKADKFKGIKIPVGKGFVGYTIEHNETLFIPDVSQDKRWYSKSDSDSGFQTKSMICVPLNIDDKAIGALQVLNKKGGGSYTERDEYILTMLATQASATIYNLMLFKEVTESKQKIESIVNGMADGVILLDESDSPTHINPSAMKDFSLKETTNGTDISESLSMIIDEIKTSKNDSHDIVLMKPEGLVLSCKSTSLGDDSDDQGMILSFRNVTKIKEKERRKSEILMLIAYQLNVPVIELLRLNKEKYENAISEDEKQEALEAFEKAEFISDLVTKLIYYSHMDAGPMRLERKPQKVEPVFTDLITDISKIFEQKNISFDVSIETESRIKFDKETIVETVHNVLTDAMLRIGESGFINLRINEQENVLFIEVEDSGCRYEDEVLGRIFDLVAQIDSFMQSDDELKDLNLNYAFANYILEAHGGSICINNSSEFNKVIIRIPNE